MTIIVRRLTPDDTQDVCALFATISNDTSAAQFHPHAFTAVEAHARAHHCGQDIYLGAWREARLQGYGMLRGWDAGFAVPSLGIYIDPNSRRTGVSRALMAALHAEARAAGAHRIRLKVYPDNKAAVRLYESLGYVFGESDQGQLVGVAKM